MKTNHKNLHKAYQFSIAPMMDCTDRHFRVMMRHISHRALLYTEMIVAKAIHHSNNLKKILDFSPIEHPIALQLGGDDPLLLAEASQIAEEWGYDEINFNVGCPSPKVKAGNFGACLMADPNLVARCIQAMKKATSLEVTVKHRIGIDDLDSDELLKAFCQSASEAGASRFAIHARKAWLEGLNAKENRTIPPLQYERVALLKEKCPELIIELNGGLNTPNDCIKALKTFDGAMVGRSAYEHPLRWQTIDALIFGEKPKCIKASEVIRELLPYSQIHLDKDGRLWDICRHVLHLVEGVPGAKKWRHNLQVKAQKTSAESSLLEEAAKQLEDEGL